MIRRILTIGAIAVAVIFLLWGGLHLLNKNSGFKSMPTDDGAVSKETYTPEVPLQTLNKQQARQRGMISRATAKDDTKKVLASGNISDTSGTRKCTAIFDTKTGKTTQEEYRPFAEWMGRQRISLGLTAGTMGYGYIGEYQVTVSRVWEVYQKGRLEVWDWKGGDRAGKVDFQVSVFPISVEFN